jgi:hypothetical protein
VTVWVLRNGQPAPVRIVIGASDNKNVEVRSGLQEGEQVIVAALRGNRRPGQRGGQGGAGGGQGGGGTTGGGTTGGGTTGGGTTGGRGTTPAGTP